MKASVCGLLKRDCDFLANFNAPVRSPSAFFRRAISRALLELADPVGLLQYRKASSRFDSIDLIARE